VLSIPSRFVTCNFDPLQNEPWPALAVYNSSSSGLYTMPISAYTHQKQNIYTPNIIM